jgi:AsmA-like C-terminal region
LHYLDTREVDKSGEIECFFGVKNGNIVEPSKNLRISNINVDGYYGNADKRLGEHLNLKEFQFQTAAGPFNGNLLLTKFNQPRYQGKAKGRVDLAVLHSIFPIPNINSTSGRVKVDSKFDVQSTSEGINLADCHGDLDFINVHCQLKDDKRYFDHITGGMYLNSNVLALEKVSLTVGRSDLLLHGKLEQLQNYLNKKGNLVAQMEVKSAFIDVQDFSTSEKAEEIKNGRNFILPNNVVGNVHLRANNLQYETHQFKNLGTNLIVNGRHLTFSSLKLQNAGADIVGNLAIHEYSPEIFTISTTASSQNIAFQPLFKEWDNFDQDVISSQNISGMVAANLKFTAPFDLRTGIDMKKIMATVDVQVENGKLTNVETFKSITESLQSSTATKMILRENNISSFEKNLLDLKFETIKNTLTIANGSLTIPKMVIASNAMTIDLSGTHDFANKVDYHFNFNLRDIKKVKLDTEFGDVVEDGTGLKLFCHMYGDLENPTITWDKNQKRQLTKETFQNEKQTTKEMLKAELGLFKKDSSVVAYKAKERPKESIQMQFGNEKKEEKALEEEKANKNTKINRTLQKWKEDVKKQKEGELVLDPE